MRRTVSNFCQEIIIIRQKRQETKIMCRPLQQLFTRAKELTRTTSFETLFTLTDLTHTVGKTSFWLNGCDLFYTVTSEHFSCDVNWILILIFWQKALVILWTVSLSVDIKVIFPRKSDIDELNLHLDILMENTWVHCILA